MMIVVAGRGFLSLAPELRPGVRKCDVVTGEALSRPS
jgi:hypothetical protein